MRFGISIWKLWSGLLLVLTLTIILPFFLNFSLDGIKFLANNTNTFSNTILRTILFAIASGILLSCIGFFGALGLINIPFFSGYGKNLSVMILPVVFGNMSIAFLCKTLIGDSVFFSKIIEEGVYYKLGFLFLLQVWQFGLLFIYLFWLQFQNIPAIKLEYALANKFSFFHKVKDIYFIHVKNLWILLACLGTVFSFFEESKIQYLFKASQGTNSELITNWLNRNYQSSLLKSPEYASDIVFSSGWTIFILAVVTICLVYWLINFIYKLNSEIILYPAKHNIKSRYGLLMSKALCLILIMIVIVPVLLSIFKISITHFADFISFPLLMTFIASVFATLTSVFLGISLRLGWKNKLDSFSNNSLIIFIALFTLLLIPPLIILLSGYKWMGIIGYSSEVVIYSIWIVGHIILTLPVLGSFVLFNHFRVSTNEINYLEVFKLNSTEFIKNSFLSRFKIEYILIFLVGFSFIWNESILNNLFSDYIPSFVSGLKMVVTGRGADFSKASGYLLISFLIGISVVLIWRYILERAQKVAGKI